ncbi:MAG: hypothetical protein M1829_005359 [Trizodia sp. TS-e1964]|nr:MAG: hypothetical protein M1829_005359 [Trizodia sp. TS-e1964]
MLSHAVRPLALLALGTILAAAAPSLTPRAEIVGTADMNVIKAGFEMAQASFSKTGLAARQKVLDKNPDMPDKNLYVVYSYITDSQVAGFLLAQLPPADATRKSVLDQMVYEFSPSISQSGRASLQLAGGYPLFSMEKEPPMSRLTPVGYVWFGNTFSEVVEKVVESAGVYQDVMRMLGALKEGWVKF